MIGEDLDLDIKRSREEGLSTIFINSKCVATNSSMGVVVNSVEDISKELIDEIQERNFKNNL